MRRIDRSDLMIAAGIVLAVAGLALYEPVLILFVAGLALAKVGFWLARPRKGGR